MDNEKIRKARIKRQEIILQSYDALKGISDPIRLDVGELVGELKETRNYSPEISDISTGVSVIRVLNLLREKQDEILSDLSRGIEIPHWKWKRLLENTDLLEEFALEIDKNYKFNSSPSSTPDHQLLFNMKELKEIIEAVFSDIKWDYNPGLGIIESIEPILSRKDPQLAIKIENLFTTLKPDTEYNMPEFIIANTYSESLLRLECLSFLISQNKIDLLKKTGSKIQDPDNRYLFRVKQTSSPEDFRPNTSVIIGLNHNDWEYLKDYYGSKREKTRREIPNLDTIKL